MLHNRSLISQPTWRVYVIHLAAKALGVLAHVEGIPIGSSRLFPRRYRASFSSSLGGASVLGNEHAPD